MIVVWYSIRSGSKVSVVNRKGGSYERAGEEVVVKVQSSST